MLPLFLPHDGIRQAEQFIKDKLKIRRLSHRRKIAMSAMIFLRAPVKVKPQLAGMARPVPERPTLEHLDYFREAVLHSESLRGDPLRKNLNIWEATDSLRRQALTPPQGLRAEMCRNQSNQMHGLGSRGQ
jgi:hypothetical protein